MADDGHLLPRARLVEVARCSTSCRTGCPIGPSRRGMTFDWQRPQSWSVASTSRPAISIPSGVVMGAMNDAVAVITGRPRPPKRRSTLEGMTLGIEVLPPGTGGC